MLADSDYHTAINGVMKQLEDKGSHLYIPWTDKNSIIASVCLGIPFFVYSDWFVQQKNEFLCWLIYPFSLSFILLSIISILMNRNIINISDNEITDPNMYEPLDLDSKIDNFKKVLDIASKKHGIVMSVLCNSVFIYFVIETSFDPYLPLLMAFMYSISYIIWSQHHYFFYMHLAGYPDLRNELQNSSYNVTNIEDDSCSEDE